MKAEKGSARGAQRGRRRGTLWLCVLVFLLAGTLAGALEFRIGLIAPFTGELKDYGASSLEGATLAIQGVNDEGGLLVAGKRFKVVLVVRDDQGIPEKAVTAAQELINQENVAAIIGPPVSRSAIPVAKLADKAMVPMITQIATNPEVTRGTRCVFRMCFTDELQSEVMAAFARNNLRAATAAVLYDLAGEYNRTVAGIFSRKFKELGGQIVASETYVTGVEDFRPQLERIRARRPDVLFLPNYVGDLRVQLDQIHQMKLATPIIGTDTMSFRQAGDIARNEGSYYSTHFSAEIPSDRVRAFSSAYQALFHRPPAQAGALTYDSLRLLFETAQSEKSIEAHALGDGLRKTVQFEGVTGVSRFNGSPDPKKSVVIVRVQNGENRFFARIDP